MTFFEMYKIKKKKNQQNGEKYILAWDWYKLMVTSEARQNVGPSNLDASLWYCCSSPRMKLMDFGCGIHFACDSFPSCFQLILLFGSWIKLDLLNTGPFSTSYLKKNSSPKRVQHKSWLVPYVISYFSDTFTNHPNRLCLVLYFWNNVCISIIYLLFLYSSPCDWHGKS